MNGKFKTIITMKEDKSAIISLQRNVTLYANGRRLFAKDDMGKTIMLGNGDNLLAYPGDIPVAGEKGISQRLSIEEPGHVITVNEGGDGFTSDPGGSGDNIVHMVPFTTEKWTQLSPDNHTLTISADQMSFGGDSKLIVQITTSSGEVVAMGTTIDASGDIILSVNQPIHGMTFIFGGGSGRAVTVTVTVTVAVAVPCTKRHFLQRHGNS
jgi:hypothetical protein